MQRGQRGILKRRERAGLGIVTRTGVNGDQLDGALDLFIRHGGQGDAQKPFDQLRAGAGSPHSQLEGRKVNVEELQRKLDELKAEPAQVHARVDPQTVVQWTHQTI